jgi:hypothetical protein
MMQWEEVDNTYIENFSGVHEREYRVPAGNVGTTWYHVYHNYTPVPY